MKKLWSGLCATTLALSFAAATLAPAAAAPVFVPKAASAESASDIQQVDHRRWHNRFERRMERRENRREVRRAIRHFERRGDWSYYNGYRGYHDRRSGYRYYNGFWFPAAAFLAGALVTGAIIDQPDVRVVRRGRSAHIDWCYNRYRSYRASDNSFQPYSRDGEYTPRQQCYSPYD